MLALLAFPMADKALHDLKHLGDAHCTISDVHYCQAEHVCSVCDYVFSGAATPPKTQEQLTLFSKPREMVFSICLLNNSFPKKYRLSLRGPPASI